MQTFDQALLRRYECGRIACDDALRAASSPHDFKLLVAAAGRTATSMDDLVHAEKDSVTAGPEAVRGSGPLPPAGAARSSPVGAPAWRARLSGFRRAKASVREALR
jgi:hypothetical protein